MRDDEEPTHPLFLYLDDEESLLPGRHALSVREMIRHAYEDLAPDDKPLFQRALCRRIGDAVRTLRERTRLLEIVPIVNADRQTRHLVRRQIVDDVRDLLRSPTVPTGDAALSYVKRLRCLGEIGAIQSSRFWQLAYQLCGSSCSMVVFTGLYKTEPRIAMTWMSVHLSRREQIRVLEKALPAIREESAASARDAEAFLDAARVDAIVARPQSTEWKDVLQSLIRSELHPEVDRGGAMEYLRNTMIDEIYPHLDRDEIHIRIAVDQLFSRWASSAIVLPLPAVLRLLTLGREFRSVTVLSSLIKYLEVLSARIPEPSSQEADAKELGIAILDSLAWFDDTIEGLSRSVGDELDEASRSELPSRLWSVLRTIRQRAEWSGRADRELVRHSLSDEDRALALVSMITGEYDVADWLEELDRRLGSENFQAIAQLVLAQYRIQSHLKPRLMFLGQWCEDAYTTRDRLVPGSGWPVYPIKGSLLESISEVRDDAEMRKLLADVPLEV
jgi:hypothetical protein